MSHIKIRAQHSKFHYTENFEEIDLNWYRIKTSNFANIQEKCMNMHVMTKTSYNSVRHVAMVI